MKITPDSSDAELLQMMRGGDEAAFVALYRRWQGGIYRFALHMCGTEAVAEDVTQEVFMILMREDNSFDPARGTVPAYLFGIARNFVLRHLRQSRGSVSLDDTNDDAISYTQHALLAPDDPLGECTRRELIERVRDAVLSLPLHYREVIVLCEFEEMSYVEAASALDCAVGTVRSRLSRARGLLTEKLRATADPDASKSNVTHARCFA